MHKWLLQLGLLCFPVFCLAQTPPATSADSAIRIATELVIVDTQVTREADGKPVGDLRASDFKLEENGVPQAITFFSQDKLNLSVVLLFDLTDTSQPVLKRLAQGALASLQHFKPSDELAVMAYSSKTLLLHSFTRDRAPLVQAIEMASQMDAPEQHAFFNEAVWQAGEYLRTEAPPQTRRLVLWLSDNLPNRPPPTVHSEQDALAQLLENDIAVYGVMLQTREGKFLNWRGRPKGAGDMFKYAEQTGGEIIKAEKEDVSRRMADIIDRLRARYALGYVSTNTSAGFRRIRVQITDAVEQREGKIILRGKAGYFVKEVKSEK